MDRFRPLRIRGALRRLVRAAAPILAGAASGLSPEVALAAGLADSVHPLPTSQRILFPFLCDEHGNHCTPEKKYYPEWIHTGLDFVSPAREPVFENRVVSTLPGRIHTMVTGIRCRGLSCDSAGNSVTIDHLLSTGERVFSHYAHLLYVPDHNPVTHLVAGDFIPSSSMIGYQGTTGTSEGTHLHFEISTSDEMSFTWECEPHWRPACVNERRLQPATGSTMLRDPAPFARGEVRVLLPEFHHKSGDGQGTPTVYGVAGGEQCASLELAPERQRSFSEIGVVGRSIGRRAEGVPVQVFLSRRESFQPGVSRRISGCSPLGAGEYELAAVAREFGSGYPLRFRVVENSRSVIVDNDLPAAGASRYRDRASGPDSAGEWNAVPGYYYSARLVRGHSGARARWKPGRSGRYRIWVHVPRGATATAVRYLIEPRGAGKDRGASEPVDQQAHQGQWVRVQAPNDRDAFDFTADGSVSLTLSTPGSRGLAPNLEAQPWQWVAFDALYFEFVAGS